MNVIISSVVKENGNKIHLKIWTSWSNLKLIRWIQIPNPANPDFQALLWAWKDRVVRWTWSLLHSNQKIERKKEESDPARVTHTNFSPNPKATSPLTEPMPATHSLHDDGDDGGGNSVRTRRDVWSYYDAPQCHTNNQLIFTKHFVVLIREEVKFTRIHGNTYRQLN